MRAWGQGPDNPNTCLQDIPNSDICSSSCEESDFSGNDVDCYAEIEIFLASKHNCDVKLSKPL